MGTSSTRTPARPGDRSGLRRGKTTKPTAARDPLSLSPEAKASVQILIVGDERTLRDSCASLLKSEGYGVRVCGRGDEALEILKHSRFDIVLLDLTCPMCRGWSCSGRAWRHTTRPS